MSTDDFAPIVRAPDPAEQAEHEAAQLPPPVVKAPPKLDEDDESTPPAPDPRQQSLFGEP